RLIRSAAGTDSVTYQGKTIEIGKPFQRLPIAEALRREGMQGDLRDRSLLSRELTKRGVEHRDSQGWGSLQLMLFETLGEKHLIQPTFLTEFPAEVSPLSRRRDSDPDLADRFEL